MKKGFSFYLMIAFSILHFCFILAIAVPVVSMLFFEQAPIIRPIGGDWRVWRGYTDDYTLSEGFTVTFSYFVSEQDKSVCYSTYDTDGGRYMGYIKVAPPENELVKDANKGKFLTDDRNGDGQKDIGIVLNDGRVLWYSITVPSDYTEGSISFPMIEEQKNTEK